jgi:hypothetical protein
MPIAESACVDRRLEERVNVAVQLEPHRGAVPSVRYRWDTDTDILSARVEGDEEGSGASGSVDLEGADGSWLILDVARGHISGVEVAVWPDVRKRSALTPPSEVEEGRLAVPARPSSPDVAALEVETNLRAESDDAEAVIYFRVGAARPARTVRLARDLLVELDPQQRIAGLWLLNVPPFPSTGPLP